MSEKTVAVERDIRAERRKAASTFQRKRSEEGTLIVRLLSSPGAGKTTLLEKTVQLLQRDYSVGVLVGDVETDRDASGSCLMCQQRRLRPVERATWSCRLSSKPCPILQAGRLTSCSSRTWAI